jgi:adenosine deaminase
MTPQKTPKIPYTLPKAEMHTHISLALSNEAFIRRVKKKRTDLSLEFLIDRETRYYPDLAKFHGTYESMRHMTNTQQELADTVQGYLERIAREGAIYAEISNSYRAGADFEWQMEAVSAGIECARHNTGIEARIIVTTLRDHGAEKAEAAANFLSTYKNPYVTGFGLVGDEGLNQFMEFSKALNIAWHDAGLGLSPHVAEQHLHNAVDFLEAIPQEALSNHPRDMRRLRLGHGVLIHMSSDLMAEFADKQICMEICLSANKRIGLPDATKAHKIGDIITSQNGNRTVTIDRPLTHYYESIADHPIKHFMDAGIPVCLGSDNPLLMNTNIGKEYSLVNQAGVTEGADHLQLTRNAILYANVDPLTRARLLSHIDDYERQVKQSDILPLETALGYKKAFMD